MKREITLLGLACLLSGGLSAETVLRRPGAWHALRNRVHVGIPSIAVSKENGRMWATWYAGCTPGEDLNSYAVLATSIDGGVCWREMLVADPDGPGPRRAFDPEVWIAPDGKLRWTWTEAVCDPSKGDLSKKYGGDEGDVKTHRLMMVEMCAESEPDLPLAVREIGRGLMMCKPTVLKDGAWLFPAAWWNEAPSARFYVTRDRGRTFSLLDGGITLPAEARLYDEHQVVERADGSLLAFVRAKSTSHPWEAVSADGGRTWSPATEARFTNCSARVFFRRLASGNLLFVKNGKIGEDCGRKGLTAFLSDDDGKTWKGGLVLDERTDVAYPDGDQRADGRIVVAYDHDRFGDREILYAEFTEKDVLAGRVESAGCGLRKLISAARLDTYSAERAALSRRVCGEGSVLLKNDGALPLAKGSKVAVFGPAVGEWLSCGGMSARVNPAYTVLVPEGLANAGFVLDDASREAAVYLVSRNCGRGGEPDLSAYEWKDAEMKMLADIKAMGFKRIVVVLNTGVALATRHLAKDPSVSAVLQVGFAGMEGGNAVADILSGAVNPSGRLVQTLAERTADYPADANWQEGVNYVPYEDDIFVGYRYFETIPGAASRVTYPFGWGLSYTTFALSDPVLVREGDRLAVRVKVTNTGKVAGRRSVLVYSSVAGGKAEHAARELRAFGKTKLLEPGADETLEMSFDRRQLAYFDDEGTSGRIGSWVIDGGEYSVWVGGDVRDVVKAGSFRQEQEILATPGFKLEPSRLARRLRANGSYTECPVTYGLKNGPPRPVAYPKAVPPRPILLRDVAEGRQTLDAFIDQLSAEDIATVLCGHRSLIHYGDTGSFGVLEKYGSTGVQTADGPLGVRIDGLGTTQFPGTDVLAGAFDPELAEACGKAIGVEARLNGIDVQLAPGVNINRHPVCARNFEFMGEDPCLAGLVAAGVIRGIQSEGVAATIKHFAANNRVNACGENTSIVGERAAREIYLRPFELAVAASAPKCVMTAYNGLNGRAAGANWGAIEGILRGEWGFDGVVMTDWGAQSIFWWEVASGNDVKMPDDAGGRQKLVRNMQKGIVDPRYVRASVRRVLSLVLGSPRFKRIVQEGAK